MVSYSAHLLLQATVVSWVPKTRFLSVSPSFMIICIKEILHLNCSSVVLPPTPLVKPRISFKPVLKVCEVSWVSLLVYPCMGKLLKIKHLKCPLQNLHVFVTHICPRLWILTLHPTYDSFLSPFCPSPLPNASKFLQISLVFLMHYKWVHYNFSTRRASQGVWDQQSPLPTF